MLLTYPGSPLEITPCSCTLSRTAELGLETYQAVTSPAMQDAGIYEIGIEYAKAMLGENYTEAAIAAEEIRKDGKNLNVKQRSCG